MAESNPQVALKTVLDTFLRYSVSLSNIGARSTTKIRRAKAKMRRDDGTRNRTTAVVVAKRRFVAKPLATTAQGSRPAESGYRIESDGVACVRANACGPEHQINPAPTDNRRC
jgi:hypothetical protein